MFQVCNEVQDQADDESSTILLDRQSSVVDTINNKDLETLKMLSGGIGMMMVRVYKAHTP